MTVVLVDTNILVYAYQTSADDQRIVRAKQVLEQIARSRNGALSTQNLAEFCSVCLHKVRPVPSQKALMETLRKFQRWFAIYPPSPLTLEYAVEGVYINKLPFWDAMIWAIAKEHEIDQVLSEDFQDGQVIDGVEFRNPLK